MKRSIGTGLVLWRLALAWGPVSRKPRRPSRRRLRAGLRHSPDGAAGQARRLHGAEEGANGYHLVVVGHNFTTRDDVEKYLAYRAAELTMEQKASWFTLTETRAKTDTAPVPKRDPAGPALQFPHGILAPGVALQGQRFPGLAELESLRGRSIRHSGSQDRHRFRGQRRHRAASGPDGRRQSAGF